MKDWPDKPMTCKQAGLTMALHIANDPDMPEKRCLAFKQHLENCPKCAKEYKESKFIIELVKRHWEVSEETLELIEKAGRNYKPKMTVEEGWKDLCRRCPDIADVFKAGCIVVDDGKEGVYPTTRDEPTDVILEDMDLPFASGSLYNGASDKWDLIRDGVTPDYIILSKDITGSMSEHDLTEGSYGYDDFKDWLATTYPSAEIEEREYTTEYWLEAMIKALLDVSEEYEL